MSARLTDDLAADVVRTGRLTFVWIEAFGLVWTTVVLSTRGYVEQPWGTRC